MEGIWGVGAILWPGQPPCDLFLSPHLGAFQAGTKALVGLGVAASRPGPHTSNSLPISR